MNRRNFLKANLIAASALAISGAAGSILNKLAAKTIRSTQSFSLEIITDKPDEAIKLSQTFFSENSFNSGIIKFSEYPAEGEMHGDIVFVNNGKLVNYKNMQGSLNSDIKTLADKLELPKKISNPSRIKFYSYSENAPAEKFLIFHKGILQKTLSAGSGNINFKIAGTKGNMLINFENNKMRVLQASCVHKTCQNSGSISIQGESIVCIPNELFIVCE